MSDCSNKCKTKKDNPLLRRRDSRITWLVVQKKRKPNRDLSPSHLTPYARGHEAFVTMQHNNNTQENFSFPDLDLGFSLDQIDDFDLFKAPHHPVSHADTGAAYLYSDSPASLTGLSAPVPLLTPDNSDGGHTDSALLMGRDPEYLRMSPLQMSPSGLEMPSQLGGVMTDDGFIDEEVCFCSRRQK